MKSFSKLICTITACACLCAGLTSAVQAEPSAKDEAAASAWQYIYYSDINAPVIYGAVDITIPTGWITDFDLQDPRFRAFSRDLEDGDLTQELSASLPEGGIDTTSAGEYTITYTVSDSDGNTTVREVPVHVSDTADTFKVLRHAYEIPSWYHLRKEPNYTKMGFSMDYQPLGIFLPDGAEATFTVKKLWDTSPWLPTLKTFSAKSSTDTAVTIDHNRTYTLTGSTASRTYGIPMIQTSSPLKDSRMFLENELNRLDVYELEFDQAAEPLSLYHYGDDEQAFVDAWRASGHPFSVIQGERVMFIMPIADIDRMTSFFGTLDKLLDYYASIIGHYEKWLGYSKDAEYWWDQQLDNRFLIRADAGGSAVASYLSTQITVNSGSMTLMTKPGWVPIHEVGHGFQSNGGLGNGGNMTLHEVTNNILAHTFQMRRDLYGLDSGSWLFSNGQTTQSLENKTYDARGWVFDGNPQNQGALDRRLVFLLNLMDEYEGVEVSYPKLCQAFRKAFFQDKRSLSGQDAWIYAMAEVYGVDVIEYFEMFNLQPSDAVRSLVASMNVPALMIPGSVMTDDEMQQFVADADLRSKMELLSVEELEASGLTGSFRLVLDTNDFDRLCGKAVRIMDGDRLVREVRITSQEIMVEGLGVGKYRVQFPAVKGVIPSDVYVLVKSENAVPADPADPNAKAYPEARAEYTFGSAPDITSELDTIRSNYTQKFVFTSTDGKQAAVLTFAKGFNSVAVSRDVNAFVGKPADSNYVQITGADGTSKLNIINNNGVHNSQGDYFGRGSIPSSVALVPGDLIRVRRNSLGNSGTFYSSFSGQYPDSSIVDELDLPADTVMTFRVTTDGLELIDEQGDVLVSAEDLRYDAAKKEILGRVEAMIEGITEEEWRNPYLFGPEKNNLQKAEQLLRPEDITPEIRNILAWISDGGLPQVSYNGPLSIKEGESTDFMMEYISASDAEDGTMTDLLNSSNTVILVEPIEGEDLANVTITVTDSDGCTGTLCLVFNYERIQTPDVPETPTNPDVPAEPDTPSSPDDAAPENPAEPDGSAPDAPSEPESPSSPDTSNPQAPSVPEDSPAPAPDSGQIPSERPETPENSESTEPSVPGGSDAPTLVLPMSPGAESGSSPAPSPEDGTGAAENVNAGDSRKAAAGTAVAALAAAGAAIMIVRARRRRDRTE